MTIISTAVTPIVQGEPIRTVDPTSWAVDLDRVIEHARLPNPPHDLASVIAMVEAATQQVENYTGLGLIAQTWQQTFSAWSSVLTLQRRPLLAVGSPAQAVTITYLDSDAAPTSLASTDYAVTGIGGGKVSPTIRVASSASWPTAYAHPEAITVTYTVGFGTTPASVPALIQHAILMTFTTFYEFREDFLEGRSTVSEIPTASKALLRGWRPLAVA